MKQFIFLLTLMLSASGHAQYGDAYHKADQDNIDKQRKAYNDAYIDALRKNTNNSTINTEGASYDEDAARKLADIFAARAGRKTSSELATEAEAKQARIKQRTAQHKADNEAILARAYKSVELRDTADKIRNPIIMNYIKVGFEPYDAKYMGNKEVSSDDKQVYQVEIPGHLSAAESVEKLLIGLESESFDELAFLVSDIQQNAGAPLTSIKAINALAKRFPERRQLTDHLSNKSYTSFFNTAFGNNNFNFMRAMKRYQDNDYPEIKDIVDLWEQYFLRDPAAAIAGVSGVKKFHPLLILAEKAYVAKDYQLADALGRTLLLTPVNKLDYTVALEMVSGASQYNYITKRADNEFMWSEYEAIKVHFPYSVTDVMLIAKAQKLPPMQVIGAIASEAFRQSPQKFDWIYRKGNADSKWKLKKLITELADAGDGDAKLFLEKNR